MNYNTPRNNNPQNMEETPTLNFFASLARSETNLGYQAQYQNLNRSSPNPLSLQEWAQAIQESIDLYQISIDRIIKKFINSITDEDPPLGSTQKNLNPIKHFSENEIYLPTFIPFNENGNPLTKEEIKNFFITPIQIFANHSYNFSPYKTKFHQLLPPEIQQLSIQIPPYTKSGPFPYSSTDIQTIKDLFKQSLISQLSYLKTSKKTPFTSSKPTNPLKCQSLKFNQIP